MAVVTHIRLTFDDKFLPLTPNSLPGYTGLILHRTVRQVTLCESDSFLVFHFWQTNQPTIRIVYVS